MLTEAGMLWAVNHISTSIVARVAIGGAEMGWPPGHVEAAIKACNRAGAA